MVDGLGSRTAQDANEDAVDTATYIGQFERQ